MEPLNTIINAFAIGIVGLLLGLQTRSIRSEVTDLRREMHDEFRSVRSELASLRSDLTNVALAVGAAPSSPSGAPGASGTR